ncbi:DNA gyrase inhibitor YacG [Aquariibacter albus]|uniref:DNA gyrase inhibitor YacG n=1 Tax=Aquariibacter albus TaxID=2759899 RepID=A0A839HKN6_9BURK|nr:DNA gyrase inhibitor YacG [Aquariibacter albus]MBB1162663.1 DNA gyrase inhibitor YacG [Aquariibacter albus]
MSGTALPRKPLQVPCPHCRQPSLFAPENPWRPFCSESCRQIDLGAWANGDYRVSASQPRTEPESLTAPPPSEGLF